VTRPAALPPSRRDLLLPAACVVGAACAGLALVPVLTKIDLPTADPEPVLAAIEAAFGLPSDSVLWTSAKTGAGVADVLPAIVARVRAPGVA
jgi:translation elongation factor EF-4